MKTLRLVVDPERLEEPEARAALERAAEILRSGGTVALPTETVYGLGANSLSREAVGKIFAAKERPRWDPLIVHVADEAMLAEVVAEVPETARRLMKAYWPGPLTLLLKRSERVPDEVTAGRELVGVRMPAHPVALELIRRAGVPVAAPSANRFGRISPTTAEHVLEDLDGRIDAVVDSGPTALGVESTVLDPGCSPMVIYRPGAITLGQIEEVAGEAEFAGVLAGVLASGGEAELDSEQRLGLPSPGVGMRHYAPRARLILVEDGEGEGNLARRVLETALEASAARVGVMLPVGMMGEESHAELRGELKEFAEIFEWGDWSDREQLAHRMFAGLRALDGTGREVIVCPVPAGGGIAEAIRDRLNKAARPRD
jgi:L-threonylcarbamoyladenylate synthase